MLFHLPVSNKRLQKEAISNIVNEHVLNESDGVRIVKVRYLNRNQRKCLARSGFVAALSKNVRRSRDVGRDKCTQRFARVLYTSPRILYNQNRF